MSFALMTYDKTTGNKQQQSHTSKWPRMRSLLLGVAVSLFVSPAINASNIPNLEQPVDFNVREQNVNEFLNALFQEIDVPLSINTDIEGNINGQFNDTAGDVFKEIANAFDLLVYYDGAVAQAYRNNEITRRLLPATDRQAKRVASIVSRMRLPDVKNTIKPEESGLLITGTERFLAQVEEILESVKRQPEQRKPQRVTVPETLLISDITFPKETPIVYQTFKLKHAWAIDTSFPVGGQTITIPGVATILGELLLGHDEKTYEDPSPRDETEGLRGQGLSKQRNQQKPQIQTISAPSSNVPRIVADSRLNAIIIRDYADNMSSYKRLIDSLDVESGMVEIEATIIDINTDKTRDLGVNWRYQGTDGNLQFGSGGSRDSALTPGNGDLAQGRGGILSLMLGEPRDFMARIQALEERGAARVVSKPHVITLSDVEAVLAATTEFFVRVAGDEEVDLFNVPVGTTLRVTPHVFNDKGLNKIKLLVNIEDGSQSSGQVDSIPVIERANISTQAVVNEGDSLLVGGLVRETYRNTNYSVPVLGKIPLLGGLFRSEQKQASRVERLFLITPRLASGIGFGGDNDRPTLKGNQTQIIDDAGRRIRDTKFKDRTPMTYWSKRSRILNDNYRQSPGNNGTQNQTMIASNNQNMREIQAKESLPAAPVSPEARRRSLPPGGDYAVIENNVFVSPFTVEPW